jgi:hypothetical protein
MATRARIAIELENGNIVSAYHHWDGYPAGLGYNLLMNWNDAAKLEDAITLGDASNWGKTAYPTQAHSFNAPQDDVNVYYGRDRGETGVECKTFEDFADFAENYDCAGEEYAYCLRRDGTWTMIARYEDNAVIEDAEDEIILRRASVIREYKKRMAA